MEILHTVKDFFHKFAGISTVDVETIGAVGTYGGMEIQDKIQLLMARLRYGAQELATPLELERSTVAGWTSTPPKSYPTRKQLPILADLLEVTVDYLIRDDDERDPREVAEEMEVRKLAKKLGWQAIYDGVLTLVIRNNPAYKSGDPVRLTDITAKGFDPPKDGKRQA